jgi:Holliday junction resolvase
MSVIGDEAERATALALARLGFEVVFQSRASRGAFDLLALRGTHSLAVQVKRSSLPLSFDRESWARMEAEAKLHQWRWVIAQIGQDDMVTWLEPARTQQGKTVRIGSKAEMQNLLLWLDGPEHPAPGNVE